MRKLRKLEIHIVVFFPTALCKLLFKSSNVWWAYYNRNCTLYVFFLNTERGKVCQTILVFFKFCILPLVLEHRAMFSTVSKSCDFHSIRAKIEVRSVSYSFLIFTTVEPSVWFRAFGDPLCLLGHGVILFSLLFLLFFISGDCKKIGISFHCTDFTVVCHYCSFYKQVYVGFFFLNWMKTFEFNGLCYAFWSSLFLKKLN